MASQGIIINPTEDMPPDPYIQMRQLKVRESTRVTPPLDDKLRRFLEYDGKILKYVPSNIFMHIFITMLFLFLFLLF